MTPEELQARVLHRDGLLLVLDKPWGIAVHRGPKATTQGLPNLEEMFDALRFGLPRAPALAHRLDRETAGCLVLGRHRKALAHLADLFKAGKVGKTYWAVVESGPDEDEGLIDLPLGRKDATRGWWMKVDPGGQTAATRWRMLGRGDGLAWLELTPLTGRTHQLRVHCAAKGFPILGDAIYGTASRETGPPLHLLSRAIVIPMQASKPPVAVTAPVPAHMRDALVSCGWSGREEPSAVMAGD